MADKIEQQNIEFGAGAAAEKLKKEYADLLKGKEFGKAETEEDRKKAAEIIKQIEGEEMKKPSVSVTHENKQTTKREDGQQRKKDNPGEANANRVDAGKDIIDKITAPNSNIIARGLQRILQKLKIF